MCRQVAQQVELELRELHDALADEYLTDTGVDAEVRGIKRGGESGSGHGRSVIWSGPLAWARMP